MTDEAMFQRARRPILAGLAAAAAAFGVLAAPAAQAQIPYLQLPAQQPKYASIVVDAATGEVLYAKRADSPRYPASITKVMTLYLMFEELAAGRMQLDDRITFSTRAAAAPPTKLFVKAGDSITVQEAMNALAMRSANDVAVAVAERLGGSEARFAAMMTLRARELGMDSTTFVNASGLPDSRQISTARDLAVLSRAIMRDFPQYYDLFSQAQFTFRGTVIRGHNNLLRRELGVDGLKTGYTNASGYNIAISGVKNDRRLIVVVLGGASTAARDNHAQDLLLTGFDVAARRERGERITVAQNLFEPEPTGPIMRPSREQGDGEQDGLKIVLTSAPAPEPQSRAASAPAGRWQVQVGAFKSRDLANEQLRLTRRRFSSTFASVETFVTDAAQGFYRARFTGLTEAKAREACETLKAQRQACMVIKPG
jgi:D-alanyl-D-alanine carboxypeptidase (penicillin-binding protein 5/6)